MVVIYVSNNGGTTWDPIHDLDNRVYVHHGQITQAIGDIDSFTFDVYPDNPQADTLQPFVTRVRALDTNAGEVEFDGRVIGVTSAMDNSGLCYRSVVCECAESYLLDTMVDTSTFLKPGSLSDETTHKPELLPSGDFLVNVKWYVNQIIAQHNALCDSHEVMRVGDIDCDDDATMVATWTYATATRDLMLEVVTELNAIRDDESVLVYKPDVALQVVPSDNVHTVSIRVYGASQEAGSITIGENMGSVTKEPDFTDVVTCVKPMGEEVRTKRSYTDGGDTKEWEQSERVGVADFLDATGEQVAYGFTYDATKGTISLDSAVANYGLITRPLMIEGYASVTDAGAVQIDQDLAKRFMNLVYRYLLAHSTPGYAVSVSAYDLSLIGHHVESFKLYDTWRVVNPLLGISEVLPIVRRTINLDDYSQSSIELGEKAPRESDVVKRIADKIDDEEAAQGRAKDASGTGQDKKVGKGEDASTGQASGGKTMVQDTVLLQPYANNNSTPSQIRTWFAWDMTRSGSGSDTNVRDVLVRIKLQSISDVLGFTDTIGIETVTTDYGRPIGKRLTNMHFSIVDVGLAIHLYRDWDYIRELTWSINTYGASAGTEEATLDISMSLGVGGLGNVNPVPPFFVIDVLRESEDGVVDITYPNYMHLTHRGREMFLYVNEGLNSECCVAYSNPALESVANIYDRHQ